MTLLPAPGASDVCYLLDLSGWVHKAFHLAGVDWMVGRVVEWLDDLERTHRPEYLVALTESTTSQTWRHRLLPEYKAHRNDKGDAFHVLSGRILEIVALRGIPVLWADDFEADDCIAAAVKQARAAGLRVVIVTEDKDLHQLVTDEAPAVMVLARGEARGVPEVVKKFGVEPARLADMLALMGDAADNVPGVPGVGEKTAAHLIRVDGDLKQIVAWAEMEIALGSKKKVHHSIVERAARAELALKLIKLDDAAPIVLDLEAAREPREVDVERLRKVYLDFGFVRRAAALEGTAA